MVNGTLISAFKSKTGLYIHLAPLFLTQYLTHNKNKSIMNFGEAIQAIKDGFKVQRDGWNGKGQYIYYVPAQIFPAVTEIAKKEFGSMVPYRAYIAMRFPDARVGVWSIAMGDVLEEDWTIVE